MRIGTPVRLKRREDFRHSEIDLSEAIGFVGDVREEDGEELIGVHFPEHRLFTPAAPAAFFEIVRLH